MFRPHVEEDFWHSQLTISLRLRVKRVNELILLLFNRT